MIPKRNYNEYNIDNILSMTPKQFGAILSEEIYSLVLVFRLLDIVAYFEAIEAYEYLVHIRDWGDLNNCTLKPLTNGEDDDEE